MWWTSNVEKWLSWKRNKISKWGEIPTWWNEINIQRRWIFRSHRWIPTLGTRNMNEKYCSAGGTRAWIQRRSWVRWRRVGRYAIRNRSTLKNASNVWFWWWAKRDCLSIGFEIVGDFWFAEDTVERHKQPPQEGNAKLLGASWTSPVTHGLFRVSEETRDRIICNASCRFAAIVWRPCSIAYMRGKTKFKPVYWEALSFGDTKDSTLRHHAFRTNAWFGFAETIVTRTICGVNNVTPRCKLEPLF